MEKKILPTKLHTVFILVGPSGAGKTHFARLHLMPQLQEQLSAVLPSWKRTNIQYISSDILRCHLLGNTYHKHDSIMLGASEGAFRLLDCIFHESTTWPISAEFVIIDTTGLSSQFRGKIIQAAKEQHYRTELVIFDYKDKDEYLKYLDGDHSKKIIFQHLKKLREDVYPNLKVNRVDNVHKIKSKDFEQYEFKIEGLPQYGRCFLSDDFEYDIIGDVHGCLDTLLTLLRQRGYTVEGNLISGHDNRKIILAGDIIDKGKQSKEMLTLLIKNPDKFLWVIGNHENFVRKWFAGKIEAGAISEELRKSYFTTTEEWAGDQHTIDLFDDLLVNRSFPFLRHKDFIVTHSPCKRKYLQKTDSYALKAQRNCRYPHRKDFASLESYTEALTDQLSYLEKESVRNHPIHFFGHIPVKYATRVNNKVFLDTGCEFGGKLTLAYVDTYKGAYVKFQTANFVGEPKEPVDLPVLFPKKTGVNAPPIDLSTLEPDEWRRIKWLAHNKVNFISGTMSPADKKDDELESLSEALAYYRRNGVDELVLQPKWMGSRCQVYLDLDIEACMAVSRNGFKIRKVDLTDLYTRLRAQYESFMQEQKIKTIILDGELMPWYALGEGLIKGHFQTAGFAIGSELQLLKDNGFDVHLAQLKDAYEASGYGEDKNVLNKKELVEKYGHAKYETYNCISQVNPIPFPLQEELLAVYNRQLDVFGAPGEVDFYPFQTLKYVYEDGSEQVLPANNLEGNKQAVLIPNTDEGLRLAEEFYRRCCDLELEGIVVKPLSPFGPTNVAPYLKVRSPSYLSIIYGFDYRLPRKYTKLLNQKNTRNKLRLSVTEWELGKRMLAIPREKISLENSEYLQLAVKLIFEERQERELDPRL